MMSGKCDYVIPVGCPECHVTILPGMEHRCEYADSTCNGRNHEWENWDVIDRGKLINASYSRETGRYVLQARKCRRCGFTQENMQKFDLGHEIIMRPEAD